MHRTFFVALALMLVPAGALASSTPVSFSAARSLLVASSSPGNAYVIGATVVVTGPVSGDLTALGGSVVTATPVSGDALLIGGTVSSRGSVSGDLRVIGGSINVSEPVAGDLALFGLSVEDSGRSSGSVFIVAANTSMSNGAAGPVIIYGNNVALAGDFAGDVTVTSSGHLTLAPGTTIHGMLSYEAPETALIPASATILGGVKYTNVSYLPSSDTSRVLELMSIGFFLLVRVLGALILAGLLAGLFPRLAEEVVERVYAGKTRSILLTILLGFAILVATPILLVVLALTFVGLGIALLIFIAYVLLAFLAFMYSGILIGSVFVRRFMHRETVLWRDGVLGMLVLSLISLLPIAGLAIVLLLTMFCAGALLLIFFHHAFPHEEQTAELL